MPSSKGANLEACGVSKRKTKKPYLRLVRYKDGFVGATEMDFERIQTDYPAGHEYEADLKTPRSLPRMGLYWSVLHHVHHNDRFGYASPEKINDALLVEAGICSPEQRIDGSIVMVPDSISFAKMDEATFRKYFDQALAIIEAHWGIPISDMLREGQRLNTKIKRPTSYPKGSSNERVEAPEGGDRGPEDEGAERKEAA